MTLLLRGPAIVAVIAAAWLVAAAQTPAPVRLQPAALVPGATLTQPFGCTTLALEPYEPACPGRHFHTGVDLAAPAGTEIRSATAGTAHLGFDALAGLYIVVTMGPRVRILYCHLSGYLVHQRETVVTGEVIGLVGASGLSTGPHLHFEVQVDGRPVDPTAWLSTP